MLEQRWLVMRWISPSIGAIVAHGSAYEDVVSQLVAAPCWHDGGTYEKRGPTTAIGSVETYWDTSIDIDHPRFEIIMMRIMDEDDLLRIAAERN